VYCCSVVKVNSKRLSVNSPTSSSVKLFMLEERVKIVVTIVVVV
jgi:hypothetical protein